MSAAGRRAQRGLRDASAAARDARPQACSPGRASQAGCRARLRGSPTSSAGGAAERRRSPSRSRSRARPARPRRPSSLPPWRLSGRSGASSSCSSTPRRGERPAPGKSRAAGGGRARWGPEAAGAAAGAGPGPIPRRSRAQAEPGRPRGSHRRGAAHPEGAARGWMGAWGVSGLGGPPTPTPQAPGVGSQRSAPCRRLVLLGGTARLGDPPPAG